MEGWHICRPARTTTYPISGPRAAMQDDPIVKCKSRNPMSPRRREPGSSSAWPRPPTFRPFRESNAPLLRPSESRSTPWVADDTVVEAGGPCDQVGSRHLLFCTADSFSRLCSWHTGGTHTCLYRGMGCLDHNPCQHSTLGVTALVASRSTKVDTVHVKSRATRGVSDQCLNLYLMPMERFSTSTLRSEDTVRVRTPSACRKSGVPSNLNTPGR